MLEIYQYVMLVFGLTFICFVFAGGFAKVVKTLIRVLDWRGRGGGG